ncbi:hypothetical protein GQX74_007751 [Glossina fuscipes]|nr:hypothetical protein GQX74_007751 [Glossina fuscipes]
MKTKCDFVSQISSVFRNPGFSILVTAVTLKRALSSLIKFLLRYLQYKLQLQEHMMDGRLHPCILMQNHICIFWIEGNLRIIYVYACTSQMATHYKISKGLKSNELPVCKWAVK